MEALVIFISSDVSVESVRSSFPHASPTTAIPEIPTASVLPAPSAIVAPSYEFLLAPVVAPPGIHRRRAILIRPGEDIPIDHFTSGSSSSHSSSDHSSSRHSSSGHSLSGHTLPDTTIADSSTLSRFVHPPLARTPQYNEAYLCWRSALLSTVELKWILNS
nr:hypothetical protein [Tanacetum cinerariifolium]